MDEGMERELLRSVTKNLHGLKKTAERAIERLDDEDLRFSPDPESNSVAVLMQHLAGNMRSRWTDFLTSDGEKPDRNRDGEFVAAPTVSGFDLRERWERGWTCLFDALAALTPADLARTVVVAGESFSAVDAILRQLSHYAVHVGQIIYVAKHRKWQTWESLSVPRRSPSR